MKTKSTTQKGSGNQNAAVKYIATSRWGWGIGEDVKTAMQKCKQNTPRDKYAGEIKVHSAHPETVIFGDGSWEYPQGHQPQLLAIF